MFLVENTLSQEIKSLLGESTRLRIAVAFIGDGASQWIGPQAKDVKILCNLTMGGTNPKEVEALIKQFGAENVKQIDNLHAKLYIGDEYAIVGSANMSKNGLGTQPSGLREAGYKFKLDQQSAQHAEWFDTLFGASSDITDEDLKAAEDQWSRRDRTRNGEHWKADSGNICDYNFDHEYFPLLEWIETEKSEIVDHPSANHSSIGGWNTIEDAVDNGVDIECDNDTRHMVANRWILKFHLRRDARPFWIQLSGTVLANILSYENGENPKSVAVSKSRADSCPFNIDDQKFLHEFRNLLFGSGKYSDLTDKNCERGWFDPRIDRMREFWKELQAILCKA